MVPSTSRARASTVMSTGESLPRSPLLRAASVTRSMEALEQSETLIKPGVAVILEFADDTQGAHVVLLRESVR